MTWPAALRLSMSALPVLTRAPALGRLAFAAGAAAACVVLGVAAAMQPLVVVGLVVLGVGGLFAMLRPTAVALLGVVAVALVPVYAAPRVGPIDVDPAVMASWGAAAGLLLLVALGRETVRPHLLDGAVALYLGLLALPVLFKVREVGEYLQLVLSTAGPYLAMRLVVPRVRPDWIPRAFALAALLALPLAVYEFASSTNPFEGLAINTAESLALDEQIRFGVRRTEGAFGHAIGLSSFAGTVMMLALGSAALAVRRGAQWAWLVVVVAAAMMLSFAFSRTGWIVFGVGVALIALRVLTGRTRARLIGTLVGATALGAVLIVALGLDSLLLGLVGDERLSKSNNYRDILIQRALRGEGLALFGLRDSPLGAGIDAFVGVSIDNAFLDIAANWGYVGGAGFVLVTLAVAFVYVRQPPGPWALVPAVTLANFAGLLVAAILTQMEFWLWMLIGATAGAYAVTQAQRAGLRPANRSG